MSAIKPVIRELSEAVLKGMAHGKDRLHQLTDNMNDHLDNIVRQVRDKDKFDDAPDTTRRTAAVQSGPRRGRQISARQPSLHRRASGADEDRPGHRVLLVRA